jgi:hypothetical protein
MQEVTGQFKVIENQKGDTEKSRKQCVVPTMAPHRERETQSHNPGDNGLTDLVGGYTHASHKLESQWGDIVWQATHHWRRSPLCCSLYLGEAILKGDLLFRLNYCEYCKKGQLQLGEPGDNLLQCLVEDSHERCHKEVRWYDVNPLRK